MEPKKPFPDELQAIAARLRAERAQPDPVQLDDIKRRVITRCATTPRRSTAMKAKIATIATLTTLLGGTGAAIAVGSEGTGNGYGYGASSAMYCKAKGVAHGCRRKPHEHHHHPGQGDHGDRGRDYGFGKQH